MGFEFKESVIISTFCVVSRRFLLILMCLQISISSWKAAWLNDKANDFAEYLLPERWSGSLYPWMAIFQRTLGYVSNWRLWKRWRSGAFAQDALPSIMQSVGILQKFDHQTQCIMVKRRLCHLFIDLWRWVPCIPAVNLAQEGLIMKVLNTWPWVCAFDRSNYDRTTASALFNGHSSGRKCDKNSVKQTINQRNLVWIWRRKFTLPEECKICLSTLHFPYF